MPLTEPDTIFALTTPPGRSGVAVTRLSGPRAFDAVEKLTRQPRPEARKAVLRRVVDLRSGREIDAALVLAFEAPHSFTGENIVEFQTHGSPAVCRMLFAALESLDGFRPAEPGEFTRRAMINDRINISQVEGLGELLVAETEAQHRQAQRLIDGELDRVADRWRALLVETAAIVHAAIDFSDEDIPDDLGPEVARRLAGLAAEISREIDGTGVAERIKDGFTVALVGKPNVGKSTLMNAIVQREVVLTSEIAGTTRDVIEAQIVLAGLPVTLLDMAGLHTTDDRIELMGIARARERAAAADLRVFLLESASDVEAIGVSFDRGDIAATAKADLRSDCGSLAVSGLTRHGIDRLLSHLSAELSARSARIGIATNARHAGAMTDALRAVEAARLSVSSGMGEDWELAAHELDQAGAALDGLVGKIGVEEILGKVFENFCLGK